MDRREFLTHTGITSAVAGLALHGATTRADDTLNRRVVLGVMGMERGRALAHGFAALPGVVIKYVCDVDLRRAKGVAASLLNSTENRPEAIGDFRRILDDAGVDGLVCAAPNHWHAPATIMACEAGKHVYVEKPCSHNPQEGEWMVSAARRHKRIVQVGTQRRSSPAFIEVIRKIQSGIIGRVYLARAFYNSGRGSIGRGRPAPVPKWLDYDLWQGPAPRRPFVDNLVHYNWHWRWHWGNGELGNNGVHGLDFCLWAMKLDFPTTVTSAGGRYSYEDDQETPDTQTVCFEFEGKQTITWSGLSCNKNGKNMMALFGTEGALEVDLNGNYRALDPSRTVIEEAIGGDRGDREHYQNFIQAIRQQDRELLTAEIDEGHKSTLLCHLGNIAQRTGTTLQCDSRNGHILNNGPANEFWSREYETGWQPRV